MKYQLVVQFPVTEDFDFDAVIELETRLTLELGEKYIVEGHDFGAGEINIFIQTDEPEAGYEKVFDMVDVDLVSNLRMAYRVKSSEDKFIWLYPADNRDSFSIQ
tara:strand:- start:887 stop:1198 length:312 start_codon:yes stop_codon:yes gene_type:complete